MRGWFRSFAGALATLVFVLSPLDAFAATKLRAIDLTVLVDRTGTDNSQVPSLGASVAFYKQGATVSSTGPVSIATGTAVSVYDTGRLEVGDTVQDGTSSSATATVASIVSRTSITLTIASGSMSLVRGERLVITSDRPTIYDEPSGTHAATGSPTPTTGAGGGVTAFSTEFFLDAIVSGGSPSVATTGQYDIQAGALEPNPFVDVRAYGYDEGGLRAAIDGLPATGGTVYIPAGEISLTSALTITKPGVRLLGDTSARSRIKASSANPTHHLVVVEALAVTLENIEFDGRGTTAGNFDCVRLAYNGSQILNGARILGCAMINARRYGLYVNGAFDTQVRDTGILYCVSNAVRCENGAAATTHIYFDNCAFTASDTDTTDEAAVYLNTTSGARFTNCRFEGNRGGATFANGLYAVSTEGLHVQSSHFEILTTGQYAADARPATYIYASLCRTPVFLNNSFYGGTDAGLRPSSAIGLAGSEYATIMGGKMSTLNTQGVSADSGSPCTVMNVEVSGAATVHTLPAGSTMIGTKGLRLPKFTTAARPAAAAADVGTVIYNTTSDQVEVINNAGAWKAVP